MFQKVLRKRIENDISQEFDSMQKVIYENLWNDSLKKKIVIETPVKDKIIIMDGEISFDNGKSFIERSDEKLIQENLKLYKEKIVDNVYNIAIEKDKQINSRRNTGDSTEGEFMDKFFELLSELDDDDISDLSNKMKLVFELKSIDEQIELVKELGDKKKLLSLLEEKHRLIKKLNTF